METSTQKPLAGHNKTSSVFTVNKKYFLGTAPKANNNLETWRLMATQMCSKYNETPELLKSMAMIRAFTWAANWTRIPRCI